MIKPVPPKPIDPNSAATPVTSKKTDSHPVERSPEMMSSRNKVENLLKENDFLGSGRHKMVKLPPEPNLDKIREAASKKLGG